MAGFTNKERLRAKFRALPKAVRRHLQQALDESGKDVSDAIRRRVPVDDGDLRDSVGYVFGDAPPTSATQALRTGGPKDDDPATDLKVTVYEGNDVAFYAGFVEHGTAPGKKGDRAGARNADIAQNKTAGRTVQRTHTGTEAQPHFFPTWREKKRSVKARMAKAVKAGVAEIAK